MDSEDSGQAEEKSEKTEEKKKVLVPVIRKQEDGYLLLSCKDCSKLTKLTIPKRDRDKSSGDFYYANCKCGEKKMQFIVRKDLKKVLIEEIFTKYFCTLCKQSHQRGNLYLDHMKFKEEVEEEKQDEEEKAMFHVPDIPKEALVQDNEEYKKEQELLSAKKINSKTKDKPSSQAKPKKKLLKFTPPTKKQTKKEKIGNFIQDLEWLLDITPNARVERDSFLNGYEKRLNKINFGNFYEDEIKLMMESLYKSAVKRIDGFASIITSESKGNERRKKSQQRSEREHASRVRRLSSRFRGKFRKNISAT